MQVEEKQFLSIREGAERTLRVRQHQWLEEASLQDRTRQRAQQVELRHVAQMQRAKADFVRQYDQKLQSQHKQQAAVCTPFELCLRCSYAR